MSPRLALARRIPGDAARERLTTASQRALAEDLLAESIDVIGREGRQPDNWESLELRCAIDALEQDLYASTLVFVARALMPVPDRNAFLGHRRDTVATLDELRGALALARGRAPVANTTAAARPMPESPQVRNATDPPSYSLPK